MVDVFSAQCKACTTFYATADDISGPYSFAYDYPDRYLNLTEEEFIEWDSSSRNSAEQRLRQQDRVKEEAQWLRRLTADIREWHKWKKVIPLHQVAVISNIRKRCTLASADGRMISWGACTPIGFG